MIVADTSALLAVVLGEAQSDACMAVLEREGEVLISAATLAEALIVSIRRNVANEVSHLVERLGFDVVPVTAATARRVAEAYARCGKGLSPAGLNLGDCFAYALAKERGCPLLYIGADFANTDVASAL